VFIAAVGVWGVFKMAFYVASQTGRSMNAEQAGDGAAASSSGAGGSGGQKGEAQQQAAAAAAGVKAASPLEPGWPGALLLPARLPDV
jgi:hypothetical protein